MKILTAFLLAVCLLNASAAPLSDAEIPNYLKEYIDRDDLGVGIVVGVVDARRPRVFSYGKTKNDGTNNVNADTLFEIGSITKIFTTLLLQDMADRGEVKLDDPIGKFLPASVKTPSRNGKQITLLDLATHTSGLPRLPPSVGSFMNRLLHRDDPYAGFGEKQLYEFLSGYKLPKDIGVHFEYSNLGMELLGHVLSLKAGANYEDLVRRRICEPLGMTNTFITVPPALQSHFATGHDESANPVKNWSSPLPGDGGLRSTANDLLKFLSAEMGLTPSRLSTAMAETQVPRRATDSAEMKIGLGWLVLTNGIVWHNGGTAGFSSWIGFDPKTRHGIVLLANCAGDPDAPAETIMGLRKYRRVVKIDYRLYDQYAGKYHGPDEDRDLLTFTRQGDRLLCHYQRQDDFELYPESDTRFFNNATGVQIIFERNTSNLVAGVTFIGPAGKAKFTREK